MRAGPRLQKTRRFRICGTALAAAIRANQHKDSPPDPPKNEPYKTHLAYVRERRDADDGEAILNEALEALRNRKD
jgi:hypothetical protein